MKDYKKLVGLLKQLDVYLNKSQIRPDIVIESKFGLSPNTPQDDRIWFGGNIFLTRIQFSYLSDVESDIGQERYSLGVFSNFLNSKSIYRNHITPDEFDEAMKIIKKIFMISKILS